MIENEVNRMARQEDLETSEVAGCCELVWCG